MCCVAQSEVPLWTGDHVIDSHQQPGVWRISLDFFLHLSQNLSAHEAPASEEIQN